MASLIAKVEINNSQLLLFISLIDNGTRLTFLSTIRFNLATSKAEIPIPLLQTIPTLIGRST